MKTYIHCGPHITGERKMQREIKYPCVSAWVCAPVVSIQSYLDLLARDAPELELSVELTELNRIYGGEPVSAELQRHFALFRLGETLQFVQIDYFKEWKHYEAATEARYALGDPSP